jgi:uncharacterized membrane protein YidH (DUF202 family)
MIRNIFLTLGIIIVVELLMHISLYHLIRLSPNYASSTTFSMPDWCRSCDTFLLTFATAIRLIALIFPLVSIADSRVFSVPRKLLALCLYIYAIYNSMYYTGNWVGAVIILITQSDDLRNFRLWLFVSAYCVSSLVDEFTHIYKWFYLDI